MYLISRFFSSSDVAFISYISLNFVFGLCTMLVTLLPRLLAIISKVQVRTKPQLYVTVSEKYTHICICICLCTYTGPSESNASSLFPWKLQQIDRAQQRYLIQQILSYKILSFIVATTISYGLLTATNESLHATLLLKHTTLYLTVLTHTAWSP